MLGPGIRLANAVMSMTPSASDDDLDSVTPLDIARCRTDINAFCEYVFRDSQSQEPWLQADLHRAWHKHIDAHARALILAPREHGKTDQIAIGRILWELGRNPQLRVKIACQDDGHAMERLTAMQGHIERNPRLRRVFPKLRPHPALSVWSQHRATIDRAGEDKDPSIEACGVLSSATGGRADLIVFDDVVDFRNAIGQPGSREMVKEVFKNVWLNLLTKAGRAIYVATPWHEDDLTHELERSREWACLRTPIPDTLDPLWPEMWPKSRLEQRLSEIHPRAFSRGFHLVALSDEDAIFRNVVACIRPDLSRMHVKGHWPRYVGVDLGHSRRKSRLSGPEKPYSVIFVVAVDERSRRWPVEVRRGHWTGPETAAQVIDVYHTHSPEVILIENNAYQDTLLDWIRLASLDATIPVQPFTTGAQKANEDIGLPGLAAEFDGLAWIVPTDGVGIEDVDRQVGPIWTWISEMRGYPVSGLSDTVMACWFAREAARPRFRVVLPFDREKMLEVGQLSEAAGVYGEGE